MRKTIGAAEDFYRIRVLQITESAPPELDWDDHILMKSTHSYKVKDSQWHRVEAVDLDTGAIFVLGEFKVKSGAERLLIKCMRDLKELTKKEFEEKYKIDCSDLS